MSDKEFKNTTKKPRVYRVKDKNESHGTKKKIMFNIPFRVCAIAKSQQGKTNFITNMLLQDDPEFYGKDFEGDNIFIFSPTLTDYKLRMIISQLEVPDDNIFDELDMDMLDAVYELIKEDYQNCIRNKEKVKNYLIIIDDSMDKLKDGGKRSPLDKLAANSRHQNVSYIITSQYYSKIPVTVRSNSNGIIIWETSDKILDSIADEHSLTSHRAFKKMFRDNIEDNHDFMIINYTNKKKDRFLNKDFEVIDYKKYDEK